MSNPLYDSPPPMRHDLPRRVNRFDPDDAFSALSQFTDTPSVYSSVNFSPRPHQGDTNYRPNDTPMSTRELEQDPRFSVDVSVYDDDDDARSLEEKQRTDDTDGRLSYLGPKMRFHSRAPWETDDEVLREEAEPPESPKHHAFPFSLGASKSQNSSSPRPSFSRPSGDSFGSRLIPKRSFDTINSQMSSKGALYALAQESLSSASLSKPPTQKDGILGKLSTTLGRARGNSSTSSPSSPILSSSRSHLFGRVPPLPRNSLSDTVLADDDPFAPNGRFATISAPMPLAEPDVHPYANPDLMMPTADSDRDSGYLSTSQFQPTTRNDSSVTVTQKFEPSAYAASRSSLSSSTGGGRNRISSVHGREISSPVAVQGTSLPPEMGPGIEGHPVGASHLPGWKEKFVPPAFSLISLEEARAQRAHGGVVNGGSLVPPPADDADTTPTHSVADLSRSTNTLNTDESSATISYEPPTAMPGGRARGRTISSGAKGARNTLHSIVGSVMSERREVESAIPPPHPASQSAAPVSHPAKPLKHKKSGFMRIFNGGKDKETDANPLPPLPSPSVTSDFASTARKSTTSRVPVPSYNQPPASESTSTLNISTSSFSALSSSESHRRVPPTLSINTVASSPLKKSAFDKQQSQAMTGLSAPVPWHSTQPQSAPADVTGFPTLKLRPTSGLFSSHFEDIVPELHLPSSLETPTSSSPTGGHFSPITPATGERFSKGDADGGKFQTTTTTSQRRINDLEAQVRAMKLELEELRSIQRRKRHETGYCDACGRGSLDFQSNGARAGSLSSDTSSSSSSSAGSAGDSKPHSVVHRPRAKTGNAARFVNALA